MHDLSLKLCKTSETSYTLELFLIFSLFQKKIQKDSFDAVESVPNYHLDECLASPWSSFLSVY